MRGIRILESITPSTIGGAEVLVADLCESLARLGADVDVFCPKGRPFIEYAAGRKLKCVSWKTHGKVDPGTVFRLTNFIRKHDVDLIHTHLSTASLLGAFASRLARVPSIAHVHGFNSIDCFKYSTRVVAVSEAVKEHLRAQGLDERRITVVHNGVDAAKFEPINSVDARQKLGYDPDVPILGAFGRMSQEKGQSVAVRAMANVVRAHPDARLLLVGRGKDKDKLESLVTELGIIENVIFTGFTEDVRTHMAACDVVLVPSLKEGFGMSAVEAMALERPVIASAVGGLKEIVVHGDTGFVVPPEESDSLAENINTLLEDKSLAARMGKLGRERMEACFELGKQTRQLLSVMEAELS